MKDIKTKEHGGKPKVKNPASRMPKELIRSTVLQAKEKSHQIADARESGMSEQSANGYATDKLESAEEWTGAKAGEVARAAGRKVAQKPWPY